MDWFDKITFIVKSKFYSNTEISEILMVNRTTIYRWLQGTEPDDLHKRKISELHRILLTRLEAQQNDNS